MKNYSWLTLLFAWALAALAGCDAQTSSTAPTPDAAAAPAPAPNVVSQKASAGVGKKGQSLADNAGIARILSAPASAFFNFEQKAVLDIQIPQALNLFKGSEGRFPKSHAEFMQKIVEANRLTLPELPAGAVYHFDSEKGELWVFPKDSVPK